MAKDVRRIAVQLEMARSEVVRAALEWADTNAFDSELTLVRACRRLRKLEQAEKLAVESGKAPKTGGAK